MKRIALALMMLALSAVSVMAGNTFDFVIETTEANQTFCFAVENAQNFVIGWGDGKTNTVVLASGLKEYSHAYAVAGLYTIRVKGKATRISFGAYETAVTPALLRDITSRLSDGVTGINSAKEMFWSATNITQFTQADWFDAVSPNVISIRSMFISASKFNQDISSWNVARVKDMDQAFLYASAFNQDLSGWDVSQVTSLKWTFAGASAFNSDIGHWNVSNVTRMDGTFSNASNFKQDISRWNVTNVVNFGSFLGGIGLSTNAYNQLLIRWSHLPLKSGLTFTGGTSTYDTGLPAACRQHIIGTYGWTITDGGSTGKPYSLTPVYQSRIQSNIPALTSAVSSVMAMSENEVLTLLPKGSGIYFVKCPTVNCGNAQGSSFTWSPDRPDVITCNFCKKSFPSPDYPENKTVTVTPPSGKTLQYQYYESPDGFEYYFKAGVDYRKAQWFSSTAYKLAQLYHLTKDKLYADRAHLILSGIATNFPDFAWKYDYPFHKVEWYTGVPTTLRGGFRTSRWSWWAYMDVPRDLVLAYDLVKEQVENPALIENFFTETCEGVLANHDTYTNMSPEFWTDLIIVGRVIGNDAYVKTAISRSKTFMGDFFHFDGFWSEAALSYHQQSAGLISRVAGYLDRYAGFDAATEFPALQTALDLVTLLRYPDRRPVPLADTWMNTASSQQTISEAQSYLIPAIGYAMLGDAKTQFHAAFTPKNGHRHFDTLGITLYSHGREMLSDLGYTHTRMHQYGVMTPAHNMVTVNQSNHATEGINRGKGNIDYLDIDNPLVKIIGVDGCAAQPQLSHNRRTSFMVNCGSTNSYYIADFYELGQGAACYDYFLHGDADRDDTLTISRADGSTVPSQAFSMMPELEREKWIPPQHEQDWVNAYKRYFAYGYFTNTVLNEYSSDDDFVRLDLAATGSICSVFIPVKDENGLQILTGRAPSHRRSNENNQTVMNYFRNFLCLRYENPQQNISYTTIIHPHTGASCVKSIERPLPNLLKINLESRTDYVFNRLDQPVEVNGINLSGLYGWVSFAQDGSLLNQHIITKAVASDISGVQGSNLLYNPVVATNFAPFVKVINRNSGISYGYVTKKIESQSATIEGPLGFEVVDGALNFKTFPHYNLEGENQAVLFEREVKSSSSEFSGVIFIQ